MEQERSSSFHVSADLRGRRPGKKGDGVGVPAMVLAGTRNSVTNKSFSLSIESNNSQQSFHSGQSKTARLRALRRPQLWPDPSDM